MDTRVPDHATDAAMAGRHALAMLGPSRKDRTKFLVRLLEAAKVRWDWRVSVLCDVVDQRAFADLVAPGGQTVPRPHLLRVADWENDPVEVAATEQRMREAEEAAGLTTGRLILAAGHSIGRAYNVPVRNTRRYALVRRVLKDNDEPFRLARRFFRFADEMLAAADPDLIYTYEWAQTPLYFAIWLAANRRGIPSVAVRYSKINADHAYWTTDRLMLNVAARERARAKHQAGARVSDAAKSYIDAFRTQPKVIKYIAAKWGIVERRGFLRWHLQYGRTIVRELINRFRGQDRALREPPFSRLFRYYAKLFLMFWHKRYFRTFSEEALERMKYVYLPLHKDAEFAQTFQATKWHDQRNTVRVFASMLPAGYRLLVREHRMNYGFRPTSSLRELWKIPNVVVIDPLDSQFKYLCHADLVVTENGSSGWEGLVLGRRVLLLARGFYEGAGLGVTVNDPQRLNRAILDILSKPPVADPAAHDVALGRMIDAEFETTFPMSDEGTDRAMDLLAETVGPAFQGDDRKPGQMREAERAGATP